MAPAIVAPLTPTASHVFADSPPQEQRALRDRLSHVVLTFRSGGDKRLAHRDLYAQDFYAWVQATTALIQAGQWEDIDQETLVEEVASLGINQKHALGSHLRNLVMHLLKWQYQPSERQTGHSWRSSIINARDEIAMLLEDSPSLAREVAALLARRYPAARSLAHDETGLPLATFPETCPWTSQQVLDADFWPEAIS
jgi:Domain of unknown function DUF29